MKKHYQSWASCYTFFSKLSLQSIRWKAWQSVPITIFFFHFLSNIRQIANNMTQNGIFIDSFKKNEEWKTKNFQYFIKFKRSDPFDNGKLDFHCDRCSTVCFFSYFLSLFRPLFIFELYTFWCFDSEAWILMLRLIIGFELNDSLWIDFDNTCYTFFKFSS